FLPPSERRLTICFPPPFTGEVPSAQREAEGASRGKSGRRRQWATHIVIEIVEQAPPRPIHLLRPFRPARVAHDLLHNAEEGCKDFARNFIALMRDHF